MAELEMSNLPQEPSAYALNERWPQFLHGEKSISKYHVYQYEHLDQLDFMKPASAVLYAEEDVAILNAVKALFRKDGWMGDGELQLFWLPPFLTGGRDTAGTLIFHVKQETNGTSFLASPIALRGL